VDDAIRAIAEPRRREIVRLIWRDELPAGQIAAHFAVTRTAISQHLRVLKDAGLIVERRAGARRFYRAVPQRVEEVRQFLETFWDDRLVTLQRAAELEEWLGATRWPSASPASAPATGRRGRPPRRPS